MNVEEYLIRVFIYIFLMTKDVEHHFLCLLAICTSFIEKRLFKSIFKWSSFIFLFPGCKSLLCILDVKFLSDVWTFTPIL